MIRPRIIALLDRMAVSHVNVSYTRLPFTSQAAEFVHNRSELGAMSVL
jgi:hypothetical protein